MKPKKLIRDKVPALILEREYETIEDKEELNRLYALKVREELAEIQHAHHKDILEFADLVEVAYCFAEQNGFSKEEIDLAMLGKYEKKGRFSNIALNNLNPQNPSNMLYFVDNYNYKTP